MSNNSVICEYEHWYTDTKTRKYEDYRCSRESLPSNKFCRFHDEDYFQTHEDEIKTSLINELKRTELNQNDPIYFIGCNIPAIEISGINQMRPIYFVNSKFHGDVKFFDTVLQTIDFADASFKGKFEMDGVEINEIFSFIKTDRKDLKNNAIKFEWCNFKRSDFSINTVDSISFKNSTLGFTKFRTFKFMRKLIIIDTTFTDKVDFSDMEFHGKATILSTSFHSNVSFQYSKFLNITKFRNVDFKEQKLVMFQKDLTKLSFTNTDITRINFGGDTIWGGNDRYTIYDDIKLAENPEKYNLSSVLSTYRNLRENYEFYLRYEEAGKFFIKEMDLKRIYFQDLTNNKTKVKKFKRYFSLINCYNILSKYGESFKHISIWSLILFFSTLVYFFIYLDVSALDKSKSLDTINHSFKLSGFNLFRLEMALERTLGAFFQINDGRLIDYLVRVTSLPILGTMFIVLRRRFERRFRH